MIITQFPNTLGWVSFEKLVNYMRERKPFFSIKRFPLPHTPTPSKRTTKGDAPLETPNLYFYFRFLLFLLVFIFFSFFRDSTQMYIYYYHKVLTRYYNKIIYFLQQNQIFRFSFAYHPMYCLCLFLDCTNIVWFFDWQFFQKPRFFELFQSVKIYLLVY